MIILDPKTSYPMLSIPSLSLAVGFLSLTKYQFEQYLYQTHQLHFPPERYSAANLTDQNEQFVGGRGVKVRYNPRVSPTQVNRANYVNAIMTTLTPDDLKAMQTHWLEKPTTTQLQFPTSAQWLSVYDAVQSVSFESGQIVKAIRERSPKPRCVAFFEALDKSNLLTGPARQVMQMEDGVLDLVTDARIGGPAVMGKPLPSLLPATDHTRVAAYVPHDAYAVGCRLVMAL
jgi:hypothetical protein